MGSRVQLQETLETLLGSSNVYFQPPESVKLVYPCIIYARSKINTKFADNLPYGYHTAYDVTVIDNNPDSPILEKMVSLSMCSHNRHFKKDNLNHDIFNLYF